MGYTFAILGKENIRLSMRVESAFKDGGEVKVHSLCGYLLQWLRSLMLS